MQEHLAITLQSMHQDMQQLERIAMNVVNASTPGYKREITAIQAQMPSSASFTHALQTASTPASSRSTVAAFSETGAVSADLMVHRDWLMGTLKSSKEKLDLALNGPGFFELMTDKGLVYTRNGQFERDAQGYLVHAQGGQVMGKNGPIQLGLSEPMIDKAGNVLDPLQENSPSLGQIKVVQFENMHALHTIGSGRFTTTQPAQVIKDGEIQIEQGFLETANVQPLQEMTHLMQVMRHFESLQKAMTAYDEMTGQAIRKLGDLG